MNKKYRKLLAQGKQSEAIEVLIHEFKNSPGNLDILLKIAVIKFNVPMYDYVGAINTLKEVLQVDEHNIKALILKTIMEYFAYGEVSNSTFRQIEKVEFSGKTKNFYTNQIPFLEALYYRNRNPNTYYSKLQRAIKEDPQASYHHFLLFRYYNQKGEKQAALKALNNAISNVKEVMRAEDDFDESDIELFINEHVRGISLSKVNYENYLKEREKLQSSRK